MSRKIASAYCVLLALLPILDVYSSFVPGISIGQLLLFVVSLIALVNLIYINSKGHHLRINYYLVALFLYTSMISAFSVLSKYYDLKQSLTNLISTILYFFFVFIGHNYLNVNLFRKTFTRLALFVALLGLTQFFLHAIGHTVIFLIPFLKLENGANVSDLYAHYSRIESCFTEPAHFAHYLCIAIVLLVSQNKLCKKDFLKLGIMMLATVLTLSGNAIVGLAAIVLAFIVRSVKTRKHYLKALLIIGIVAIFVLIFSRTDEFKTLLGRTSEITGKSESSTSGYVRILRGYELFAQFPLIFKIFGIGVGNIGSFCMFYQIEGSVYISETNSLFYYLNGFQYYLTGVGIVGLVIYLLFLLTKSKKTNLHTYMLFLIIAYSLIAALYLSSVWLIMIIVLLGEKKLNYAKVRNSEYQVDRVRDTKKFYSVLSKE